MAQKLISKSFKMPKGCHVRRVELRKDGALVGYDCGGGGRGSFRTPDGGIGNYPSALVKGVRAVSHAGAGIYGEGTKLSFVLSPRYVRCSKSAGSSELECHLYNDAGLLAGSRRRRRRR